MNHEEFEFIFEEQVRLCRELLTAKSAEYSVEGDKLHNFKVAAELQGETPREALGGMFAKHIVSVFDLIKRPGDIDRPLWEEKINDSLNYLFLLKAIMLDELMEDERDGN